MKRLSNFTRFCLFIVGIGLSLSYSFVCWYVYQDQSISTDSRFTAIQGPHSGVYYAAVANRTLYARHDPSNVEDLYRLAVVRSPADFSILMSFFRYMEIRKCCVEMATAVLSEAVRRSPNSTRIYSYAVAYLFVTGQIDQARTLFRKAVKMNVVSVRELLTTVLNDDVRVEDAVDIVPRTSDGLSVLASYLSKKGPDYKEVWLKTVQDLYAQQVEPKQLVTTAEEAIRLREFDVATEYLDRALQFSETQDQAEKMIRRLEKMKAHSK